MKHKLYLYFLFVLLLVLAACNAAGGSEPAVENSGESTSAASETPANKVAVDHCAEAEPGMQQMIAASQGVCFTYPDNYDVFQGEDGDLTLYVGSLLNTEAPRQPLKQKC